MNYLLARIKNSRKQPYRVVVSGKDVFDKFKSNIKDYPEYDSDHKLDEDSWFKIDNFKSKVYCIELLKNNFDSKDYPILEKKEFNEINFLCYVHDDDFYFQKITPSLFLNKRTLVFSDAAKIEKSENTIVINNLPDAIYFKNKDTLIFRNLSSISSIFQGIDQLYKEATQAQVVEFLSNPFIKIDNGFSAELVSKPNRKRIALAIATLDSMSDQDKLDIFEYIEEYCGDRIAFDSKNGKCLVSTDEELKNLVYGIEQRFYTTPIGKERRLANSVQVIS